MGNVDFSSIGMGQVAISITPYLRGGAAIVKKVSRSLVSRNRKRPEIKFEV